MPCLGEPESCELLSAGVGGTQVLSQQVASIISEHWAKLGDCLGHVKKGPHQLVQKEKSAESC